MKAFYIIIFLTLISFSVKSQSTSDTRDFSTDYYVYTNGGGANSSSGGGLELWANTAGTNKEVFISYQLCTDESNYSNCTSSARLMQVGDAISFEMKGFQVYGEVGVILNCTPSFSSSYSAKNSNQALEIRSNGHGDYWHIIHSGSNIETSFQSSSTSQTWNVSIELTSKTTAKVTLDDGGTPVNYYPTLANSQITHITFYLKDDWSGSWNNQNFYFGDDGNDMLISNDGSLTITDPNNNLTFGDISNPFQPGSTSSTHNLNLTIDDDLTIEGDVEIGGNLIVNSSKTLTLGVNSSNEYSQLKVGGTITNNGNVVHEQLTAGFGTTSGTASALYEYSAGDFLSSAGSFSVTGTPNTSHDWTLSYVTNSASGASDNGWNLIGNPYSATLDWNSVSVGSSVNGAVYVWGTGTAYNISTTMSSNTTTSQSPTFQKAQNDRIKLSIINLSDHSKNDETVIAHSPGSVDGFDEKLDAWKLNNYGGNPNVYSFYAGDKLAVNVVDLSIPKVIPLGIDAPQSRDVYQLYLNQEVNGDEYEVILEDKHLNTFTDLTQGAYSFQYGGWINRRTMRSSFIPMKLFTLSISFGLWMVG